MPQVIRQNWEERLGSEGGRTLQSILRPFVHLQSDNTRLLKEGCVVLLAATDVGIPTLIPGISLHDELQLLVEAGLTPLEALRAATLNPAHVLGLADSLGAIATGKLADLVLLDANPLASISNTRRIHGVIADGRLYRRAALDSILAVQR
ncbi:MAG: amidohydrolase family protein [Gemmatimonadaceae bacterium]